MKKTSSDGYPLSDDKKTENSPPKEDKIFLTQTIRNSAGVLVTDIGKEDENGISK